MSETILLNNKEFETKLKQQKSYVSALVGKVQLLFLVNND